MYSRRRPPTQWWQSRGVVGLAFAIAGILSSRIATLWFASVIVSGVLVALLLHVMSMASQLPSIIQKTIRKDVG